MNYKKDVFFGVYKNMMSIIIETFSRCINVEECNREIYRKYEFYVQKLLMK